MDPSSPRSHNPPKPTPFCATRGYVGIHTSGFRDFLLKSELLRAVTDCGFEHPSEGSYRHNLHRHCATAAATANAA